MNLFKLYLEALDGKWFSSLRKWIHKTGQIRVVVAFLLVCVAALIYVYDHLFNVDVVVDDGVIDPNWSWVDDLLFYSYYLIAIPMILLNGIAWIISGLKINLIFIIELILLAFFVYLYHPGLLENIEIITLSLIILGLLVLLLPTQNKHNKHRSSRKSKHRSSRRRSSQQSSSRDSHEI